MLASLKWINDYAPINYESDSDLQALCDTLDLTGTSVEGVSKIGDQFDHIVTAKVLEKTKHPDSDHMWVCKVDVGEHNLGEDGKAEPLQIVCGAQNFESGDHIVTSMVGAVLPGGIKIKKSKLRGVMSCGMNCSESELGLGSDHDGIMILPNDAPVGMPFAEYLGKSDTILDLEITPNRPDCLSVRGLAREFAAITHVKWTDPLQEQIKDFKPVATEDTIEDEVKITVDEAELCPRYTAAVIKGVKVGPSPDWLVEKVTSMGQRSINNIVDATNYIMFLYGQPMHAFDLDWLKGTSDVAHVIVRRAKSGEKLTTLDGVERELSCDMTLITTEASGAVGLAGVMGGLNSEIVEDTRDVMIEVATFDPGTTSRTSRNLRLFSESSMRYERGVDDHEIEKRALAAAMLIKEVAGGEILSNKDGEFGLIDVWKKKSQVEVLTFRCDRFCKFVGENIDRKFIVDVLVSLGCEVKEDGDTLEVTPPTFRPDLTREIDLYEEVLRIYGEDKIPSTLPSSQKRVGQLTGHDMTRRKIDQTLRASGLDETISYSFVSSEEVEKFQPLEMSGAKSCELINPLNSEQSVMRQSIVPGLIRSVAFNQNHSCEAAALYEIGETFTTINERKLPKERERVAGVLWGKATSKGWDQSERYFDFFDGKTVIENLVDTLNIQKVRFKPCDDKEYPYLCPGRFAQIFSGGTLLGWLGEIHPRLLADYEINGSLTAFELDFNALQNTQQQSKPYKELSDYPSIVIDQNFVVDEDVTAERMTQVITSAGGKLLDCVELVDIYRDKETIGVGKKSMSFKLTYSDLNRTLTAQEVEKAHNKVVVKTSGATGASLRS